MRVAHRVSASMVPLRPTPRLSAFVLAGALAACATPRPPLYYWGNYPDQLYAHLKADGSPEQQLDAMERISTEAAGKGQALPPGFRAHMALLMLKLGKDDQAKELMRAERDTFPESGTFMSFLLKDKPERNGPPSKPERPSRGAVGGHASGNAARADRTDRSR